MEAEKDAGDLSALTDVLERLARQAGFERLSGDGAWYGYAEEFAALVDAAKTEEREACASLVDAMEIAKPSGITKAEQLRIYDVLSTASEHIRKRSNAQGKPTAANKPNEG